MTRENYVRLRNDVNRAIKYLLHEQGEQIAGVPGLSMTKTGFVNEVLINELSKRGHYPPKDTVAAGEGEE